MSDEMDDLEKFCDAVSVTANAGKTSAMTWPSKP